MFFDQQSGVVLVGTSQGRILSIERLASNAYLMGDRTVYANRTDGHGEVSRTGMANVRYGLVNKVVELTKDMSVVRWKDVPNPLGAETSSSVLGMFTTPVLWAGEDFGWWGDMSWSQNIPDGCRVVMAVRMAGSEDALIASPWKTTEYDSSGSQSWTLSEIAVGGSYAQIRVMFTSSQTATTPSVSNLVLPYYAKHASYFFVTKMTMTKGTSIRGGMLTASVSVPKNTEVKWGVSPKNTGKWNDFIGVNPDQLFELQGNFGDRMKVGVKMVVYDDENYPSIDEFSVAFDSDVDNLINRT